MVGRHIGKGIARDGALGEAVHFHIGDPAVGVGRDDKGLAFGVDSQSKCGIEEQIQEGKF